MLDYNVIRFWNDELIAAIEDEGQLGAEKKLLS